MSRSGKGHGADDEKNGDAGHHAPGGDRADRRPEASDPADGNVQPPAGVWHLEATWSLPDTPRRRVAACCRSEPECVLCPLLAVNEGASLQELWSRGLYARLPELGFR